MERCEMTAYTTEEREELILKAAVAIFGMGRQDQDGLQWTIIKDVSGNSLTLTRLAGDWMDEEETERFWALHLNIASEDGVIIDSDAVDCSCLIHILIDLLTEGYDLKDEYPLGTRRMLPLRRSIGAIERLMALYWRDPLIRKKVIELTQN